MLRLRLMLSTSVLELGLLLCRRSLEPFFQINQIHGYQLRQCKPNISYSADTVGNITIDSLTTEAPIEDPPIEYPYAIAGGITALVGLAELVIFFFRGDTLKDDASRNKSGSRWEFLKLSNLTQIPNKGLHFAFILFLFIFWSLPIGKYNIYPIISESFFLQ